MVAIGCIAVPSSGFCLVFMFVNEVAHRLSIAHTTSDEEATRVENEKSGHGARIFLAGTCV